MKPVKYDKSEFEGTIIFTCDTDFSIYDYAPDYTIYKKGWFRGQEEKIVVMKSNIMNPGTKHEYFVFDKLEQAEDFVKNQIRRATK